MSTSDPNGYYYQSDGVFPPRRRGLLRRFWRALCAAWWIFRVEWRGDYWEA